MLLFCRLIKIKVISKYNMLFSSIIYSETTCKILKSVEEQYPLITPAQPYLNILSDNTSAVLKPQNLIMSKIRCKSPD